MRFAFEVITLLLIGAVGVAASSRQENPFGLDSDNLTDLETDVKPSKNAKRSPLEVGFVSFELDHRQGRHFNVPALVRSNYLHKSIPIVSKSRTVSTTSTISADKGPKGDHIVVPLGNDHVIIPLQVDKLHPLIPKIIVDHKELLVDHAAEVVLDQKHVILEHTPQRTLVLEHSAQKPLVQVHPDQHSVVLGHSGSHTVIFEHKPVLVDRGEHETNVLVHSVPKTLVLEHKPMVVAHPRRKSIVVGASRTILLSPKTQIHEIIVHRHVPKAVVVHQNDEEDRNVFRSHFGGFGVGLNYGGHGAGHGFHVPVI